MCDINQGRLERHRAVYLYKILATEETASESYLSNQCIFLNWVSRIGLSSPDNVVSWFCFFLDRNNLGIQ